MSHHSVALHVARLADRLVLLHDVRLSGKDAVTFKTAEVLQMPVLALSLSVLITEDQLWTDTEWRSDHAADLKTTEKLMHPKSQ